MTVMLMGVVYSAIMDPETAELKANMKSLVLQVNDSKITQLMRELVNDWELKYRATFSETVTEVHEVVTTVRQMDLAAIIAQALAAVQRVVELLQSLYTVFHPTA